MMSMAPMEKTTLPPRSGRRSSRYGKIRLAARALENCMYA